MTYAFVEDVAASWERYAPFAAAFEGGAPGLILHAAGPTEEGFRIISVWETEEAWTRFLEERLDIASALRAVRVPPVLRALRAAHLVVGSSSAVVLPENTSPA